MKKILFVIAAAAMVLPLIAGASFAAGPGAFSYSDKNYELSSDTANRPSCTISLSKNVAAYYDAPADAAGIVGQQYEIATAHTSGNKIYGSHSAATLIYWKDNPLGVAPDADDADSTDMETNWTEM